MKIIKGIFYTVLIGVVGLFLLGFCCSLASRGKYERNTSYRSSLGEEELDPELKPIYNSEIERELIEEVKRLKDYTYPTARAEEAEARRKLRSYRWDREVEKRIEESEEWRKREGRRY